MDLEQRLSEKGNNYELEVMMFNGKMDIKLKIFTREVRKNFESTLI